MKLVRECTSLEVIDGLVLNLSDLCNLLPSIVKVEFKLTIQYAVELILLSILEHHSVHCGKVLPQMERLFSDQ